MRKYLKNLGVIIKNMLFYTAWFCFFVAFFYLGDIVYWFCTFIFYRAYLFTTKNDVKNQVIFKDKFYLILKNIMFYISCLYFVKIIYIICIYNDIAYKNVQITANIVYAIISGIMYLYLTRVCKNYKIYFKIYFVLFFAIFCSYWYYNDYIKQPNAFITKILQAKLEPRKYENGYFVNDSSIYDDINNQIKGKSYSKIKEILKQYDLDTNEPDYFYCYKMILGEVIGVDFVLENDKVINIIIHKLSKNLAKHNRV